MTHNAAKQRNAKNSVWKRPTVIIAIIACIQTIFITAIAAAFNPQLVAEVLAYMQRPADYPTPDFVGVGLPNPHPVDETTEPTIASSTPTPIPPTSTFTPVFLPGEDWAGNCISVSIWKPYLAGASKSGGNSCYALSDWGINANQGSLGFATNQSKLSAYEYGIFTPWQQNWTEVDFSVNIKDLNNSELWFGFFAGDPPSSTGIVFVIQPNDTVDVREMPSENAIVNNVGLPFAGGKFDPKITFEGGKFALWIDGQGILSNWPINFTIRNMFIGYRTLPVVNLDVIIYDLKFK